MKKFHKQGGGSTGFQINFSDILKLKLLISIDCQINHISKTLSVKGALPHILGVHSLTHNRPLDLERIIFSFLSYRVLFLDALASFAFKLSVSK